MRHSDDTPPSSLRGRLCDVFFRALIDEQADQLLLRLGNKAQIDEPLFGTAAGLEALRKRLIEIGRWLGEHSARYEHERTVRGVDRDVAEGVLEVRAGDIPVSLPAAVVMGRGRNREVSLRIYMAPYPAERAPKGPDAPPSVELVPPADVSELLADVSELLADTAFGSATQLGEHFEEKAVLRDTRGVEHDRATLLKTLGDMRLDARGFADDGRCCAVEIAGAGLGRLMVFDRSDSGLFRGVRIYG